MFIFIDRISISQPFRAGNQSAEGLNDVVPIARSGRYSSVKAVFGAGGGLGRRMRTEVDSRGGGGYFSKMLERNENRNGSGV